MGLRTLTFWQAATGSEYKTPIVNLESRIKSITQGTIALNLGSGVGALLAGEYYYDSATKILYIRCTDSGDPSAKTMLFNTYFLVFGTWATQAEMENLELFQGFKCEANMYLRYVKIWIVKKGNPTFANLSLQIHPELNGVPTEKVLASSQNQFTNSQVSNSENVAAEIYFRFADVPLKEDEKYVLVLKGVGVFSTNVHVSWMKLDHIYSGVNEDYEAITKGVHRFSIIGRKVYSS